MNVEPPLVVKKNDPIPNKFNAIITSLSVVPEYDVVYDVVTPPDVAINIIVLLSYVYEVTSQK